jgi:hypothetical protein
MNKIAVLVFADSETHADMGRMANALEIVKEFKDAGDEAKLIFDGAGTTWPGKLAEESHPLHPLYKSVKGNIVGACSYCAKAFGAKEGVEKAGIALLSEFEGHPSTRQLVLDGYQIITL